MCSEGHLQERAHLAAQAAMRTIASVHESCTGTVHGYLPPGVRLVVYEPPGMVPGSLKKSVAPSQPCGRSRS